MSDRRRANIKWTVCGPDHEGSLSFDAAQLAVLMDIRDELQAANAALRTLRALAQCPNVRRGFIAMRKLREHLAPAKPRRKKGKRS